ncbi:unnamed protein product [Auanema sp. JU1783]|nr:unnamed protein product [Auanema sp. JU1783]
MAKEFTFNWRPIVNKVLVEGSIFDKVEDVSVSSHETQGEIKYNVKVDEFGFFVQVLVDGRDALVIDLSQVWEARRYGSPALWKSETDSTPRTIRENFEERIVWITHGEDIVNVKNIYFVAESMEVARIWRHGLNDILRQAKVRHVCPTTNFLKYWKWLTLSVSDRRKIPTKHLIKTFSSGKSEKMVQKCLADLGLGGEKYSVPRVINRSMGRKLRNFYKCRSRRKRKDKEEIDVETLTFERFQRLLYKICPRNDVQELFVKLSGQKEYLTTERLVVFLNEEQRDPRLNEILFPFYDTSKTQALVNKYETDSNYLEAGKMSGEAFLKYLMSDENSVVFLDRVDLFQDMDHPLCHYYINSSHNTYLTGRQYGGKSSSDIYRQVLLSGCRCIELDCWDGTGDNKGEPIITHGKAMCTDVFFKDVLYQIRDTAFARSDYPVILSFENHCSKSNQLKMARYCMDIFGDMLLTKPFEDFALEPAVPLPSPNRLKRKILIKNKRLKPEIEKHQLEQFLREGKLDEEDEYQETPEVVGEDVVMPPDDDVSDEDDPSVQSSDNVVRGPTIDTVPLLSPSDRLQKLSFRSPKFSLRGISTKRRQSPIAGDQRAHPEEVAAPVTAPVKTGEPSKENDEAHPELQKQNFISKNLKSLGFSKKQAVLTKEEEERIFAEYHYTGATTNIHPLLSSLINYTHPVKFSGFDVADANNLHFHMSSFSESTGLGYLKASAPEFVNYNKRQLSRIYPKGARVDSSNFLPQIFWNAGCQMVSLNYQTPDIYMQLNMGKFEYNGGSGYLLKPDFMRRPDRTFDPFSESPVDGVIAAHCSVRVIGAQFLTERKIGTYVEVEMYGLPTDTIRKEHKTKVVAGNGLNPVYNEDPFVFRKVVLPELAVLRFAAFDENGKQLGQRILPLDGLQAGFRHISLRNETNQSTILVPTIFVHIVLKTYVPDELSGLVDALADPRAYLSEQKKREEALANMGVDDNDIAEVPISKPKTKLLQKSNGSAANLLNDKENPPVSARSEPAGPSMPMKTYTEPGLDKFKVDPIEIDDLRKDKQFAKLLKKIQKDEEDLKKKHQKQRDSIQKQQQTNVDKLITHNRRSTKKDKGSRKSVSERGGTDGACSSDIATNDKVRSLVNSQTDEWSAMIKKHEVEEFELRKNHVKEQFDLLKKLLSDAQKAQMQALKLRLESETKELKQNQTKKSIEDARVIQMDKSIKTKAERDRRVKEQNDKNLKMFVEERRRLAMKAEKHEEQLAKRHVDQADQLEREFDRAKEQEEALFREDQLASQPSSVV